MAGVRVRNLTKVFGSVVAAKNLNLDVKDGEFVVLVGPSGCGKTTALRCIAGLENPEKGEIYIGDTPVTGLPPRDRNIAMVFQSYALYPHMTVRDNLAFPLKVGKTRFSEEEISKKVKEVAQFLNIERLLDKKPSQLSGGEAQRTALGRSIIREPKVFLLDEPLSNLDAKLRVRMRVELKKLQRELGVTTIYVTHDQAEAMTMGDRIVVMNAGELLQIGTPREVYDKPVNEFVAGFVGSPSMNYFDASLTSLEGSMHLNAGFVQISLSKNVIDSLNGAFNGQEYIVGIRPEDLKVSKSSSKFPRRLGGVFEGQVFLTEPLGSQNLVHIEVDDLEIRALVNPEFDVEVNEMVHLFISSENLHIFDKKNKRRVN